MPISKFDDYLVQQIPTTTDHVEDSDPRWYERYWFNLHDHSHSVVLSQGLGVYPNRNLMDGFAALVHRGEQRNVRVARALNHERYDTLLGPLGVKVVKGLRTVRLTLGENEQGISYDLTLEAATAPVDRAPLPFIRVNGLVHQRAAIFSQCGSVSGWIEIDGKRMGASPEQWSFTKTNSWGIRSHVGGPEVDTLAPRRADGLTEWKPTGVFLAAQFSDRYVCIIDGDGEIVYRHGDPRSRVRIVGAEHSFEYHPGTVRPRRMASACVDEHGNKFRVTADLRTTVYLKGVYGAHKDFFDGLSSGTSSEPRIESERFSVSDPAHTGAIAGRDNHVGEFRLGGESGPGVVEIGVRGREPYAPYAPAKVARRAKVKSKA